VVSAALDALQQMFSCPPVLVWMLEARAAVPPVDGLAHKRAPAASLR
jgi:hypothetical protein